MSSEETQLATVDRGSVDRYEPRNLTELNTLAKIVVESNLAPKHVKIWQDAFLIMKRGAELGVSTQVALENIFVIGGKTSMYADLAVALVKRQGHRFVVVDSTDRAATVKTVRRGHTDTGETYEEGKPFEYTIQNAKSAGYTSNALYQKIPRNMLLARAKMELARMVYEDVLHGIYDPTELIEIAPAEIVEQASTHYGASATSRTPAPKAEQPEGVIEAEFDEPDEIDPAWMSTWMSANRRYRAVVAELLPPDLGVMFHEALKAKHQVLSSKDIASTALHDTSDKLQQLKDPATWAQSAVSRYLHEDGTARTTAELEELDRRDAEARG